MNRLAPREVLCNTEPSILGLAFASAGLVSCSVLQRAPATVNYSGCLQPPQKSHQHLRSLSYDGSRGTGGTSRSVSPEDAGFSKGVLPFGSFSQGFCGAGFKVWIPWVGSHPPLRFSSGCCKGFRDCAWKFHMDLCLLTAYSYVSRLGESDVGRTSSD